MQRQRGELVPIGEVIGGLGGPVKALRDASPQARRGFTLADQVNQLVSASEADADLGFMARTMALCSLPRSNPGNRKEYKRVNDPSRSTWSRAVVTSSPTATCRACCWPGCAPKRCGPEAVCWSWGSRCPSSCGCSASTAATVERKPGSAIRWIACFMPALS